MRLPEHLDGLDGLIIPGGEKHLPGRGLWISTDFVSPVIEEVRNGMPVWGTCAGMIMLSGKLVESKPEPLGLMEVEVQRNAYGRQVDSFEADVPVACLGKPDFRAVFIRAPKVVGLGKNVEVLASHPGGGAVAIQEGHMLATAFHPELTQDTRFHRYFVDMTG